MYALVAPIIRLHGRPSFLPLQLVNPSQCEKDGIVIEYERAELQIQIWREKLIYDPVRLLKQFEGDVTKVHNKVFSFV